MEQKEDEQCCWRMELNGVTVSEKLVNGMETVRPASYTIRNRTVSRPIANGKNVPERQKYRERLIPDELFSAFVLSTTIPQDSDGLRYLRREFAS